LLTYNKDNLKINSNKEIYFGSYTILENAPRIKFYKKEFKKRI